MHTGPLALEDTALDATALDELIAPLPLDAVELALDELAPVPDPLALLPLEAAGLPVEPPFPLAPPLPP